MVPGVVVLSSVVVWGIEWYVLCAGGCGRADPHGVEETVQRGGQVPQHAGQSMTSTLRAGSPQGLANGLTHTNAHAHTPTHMRCCSPVSSSLHGVTSLDSHMLSREGWRKGKILFMIILCDRPV